MCSGKLENIEAAISNLQGGPTGRREGPGANAQRPGDLGGGAKKNFYDCIQDIKPQRSTKLHTF